MSNRILKLSKLCILVLIGLILLFSLPANGTDNENCESIQNDQSINFNIADRVSTIKPDHMSGDLLINPEVIQTTNFLPYWIERDTSPRPSARQHFGIAYDEYNDKVIIYGGSDGSVLADTWAYDYKTNIWEKLDPATAPPAMQGHAMTYDPVSHRIILFGSGQTWTYSYQSNTWTMQSPQVSPASRSYHSMIYDSIRHKVIMIGGTSASFETWELDLTSFNWTNLEPVTPIPRLFAMAASFDPINDKIIVFGGQNTTASAYNREDTFAYDYNSNEWIQLFPNGSPSERRFYGKPMEYHPRYQKSVLFGGINNSGRINETWSFDYLTNSWEQISTFQTPPATWIHGMVYSSNSQRFLMFGGNDGVRTDKTYELNAFNPVEVISPGDRQFELDQISSISWLLNAPFGGAYEILLNDLVIDTGVFIDGQKISIIPFGLGLGNYSLQMTATDTQGNTVVDEINVEVVEVQPPSINEPDDIEVTYTGDKRNITWILEDLSPASFTITRNDTVILEGDWFNGQHLVVDLSDLVVGHYIFTITVKDSFGNFASDTVLVDVMNDGLPSITGPLDINMIQGDPSKKITWYLSDNNPTFYVLEINQGIAVNQSWVALPLIEVSLSQYAPGNYNFTLIVHDGSGNMGVDTVIVQITQRTQNTNTQAKTTPQSGGGGGIFRGTIPPEAVTGAAILGGGVLFIAILRRVRGG